MTELCLDPNPWPINFSLPEINPGPRPTLPSPKNIEPEAFSLSRENLTIEPGLPTVKECSPFFAIFTRCLWDIGEFDPHVFIAGTALEAREDDSYTVSSTATIDEILAFNKQELRYTLSLETDPITIEDNETGEVFEFDIDNSADRGAKLLYMISNPDNPIGKELTKEWVDNLPYPILAKAYLEFKRGPIQGALPPIMGQICYLLNLYEGNEPTEFSPSAASGAIEFAKSARKVLEAKCSKEFDVLGANASQGHATELKRAIYLVDFRLDDKLQVLPDATGKSFREQINDTYAGLFLRYSDRRVIDSLIPSQTATERRALLFSMLALHRDGSIDLPEFPTKDPKYWFLSIDGWMGKLRIKVLQGFSKPSGGE